MLSIANGHDWGTSTHPLSGDEVITGEGKLGYVMHTCPGRGLLPAGSQHRYVQIDGQPTIAWHISQLRPAPISMPVVVVSMGDDQRDVRCDATAHLADGSAWISHVGSPEDVIRADEYSVVEVPKITEGRRAIARGLAASGWALV